MTTAASHKVAMVTAEDIGELTEHLFYLYLDGLFLSPKV